MVSVCVSCVYRVTRNTCTNLHRDAADLILHIPFHLRASRTAVTQVLHDDRTYSRGRLDLRMGSHSLRSDFICVIVKSPTECSICFKKHCMVP
jgi:hypothetical protein